MISVGDVLEDYEKVSGITLRTLKFGYIFFRPWIDSSAVFYYLLNIYYFIVSILYAEGQVIFKMISMFNRVSVFISLKLKVTVSLTCRNWTTSTKF